MNKNENPEAFEKACKLYCKGMALRLKDRNAPTAKLLLKQLDLSHSQADLAWYVSELNPERVEAASIEPTSENVVLLRAGKHPEYPDRVMSWGYIACAIGKPEGTVRNLFGQGAGIAAEGTRSGKGGAFLNKEPRFYLNANKRAGVEDEKPRLLDPNEVAAKSADYEPKLPKIAAAKKAAKTRAQKRAKAARNAQAAS